MNRKPRNFLRFLRYVRPYTGWVVLTVIGDVVIQPGKEPGYGG